MSANLTDTDFLQEQNGLKPTEPPPDKISEYIQDHRIMPPNTPFPGPWDNSHTPYMIEPMDFMSPFSPITCDSTMKGSQIGWTAGAENVIGYYMDAFPADILYVNATEDNLIKWVTKRLEKMIDSCDIRKKIFAQIENTKTRRSGDKIFSKEFIGGFLDMASAQSAASLRMDTKRILVIDEVDGAPRLLRTGEGVWLEVAHARTRAWGARKKIMEFSTPTTFEESLIKDRYEMGDQRRYMISCTFCGKYQPLEFKNLKPETEKGILQLAFYVCDFCGEAMFNDHKRVFLKKGRWEPMAIASSKTHTSRQISSMYSPVGMFSWTEMYQEYLNAQLDPLHGMRSFTNLYLGLPYKEKGSRPKVENIIQLRGGYREGKVPDGVLYIAIGIDVQQGSKTDENNPPRIELEVLGIGSGYRTWSILYKVIPGDIDDAFSGSWEELHQWALETKLEFKRSDGRVFTPKIIFIDSGDGPYLDVVLKFTGRWGPNTYPSKGFGVLKANRKKGEDGDMPGNHNMKRYRAARSSKYGDVAFYEISTNYYKTAIYNNLKITRKDIGPQKPGFCDFPLDRSEKYFRMLSAEEKRADGSFHAGGRRNEALDCRVMAMCAGDVWLDAKVLEFKAAAKADGAGEHDLQGIDHRFVLGILEKQTARK
jgi:phage terminase large subunit GpA-like protein